MKVWKRGRFQWVVHDDHSGGGGIYANKRSYLTLTVWHDQHGNTLDLTFPGIGDVRVLWETMPWSPPFDDYYARDRARAQLALGRLVIWRRSYPETITLDAEVKYRNRLAQEKREREQR